MRRSIAVLVGLALAGAGACRTKDGADTPAGGPHSAAEPFALPESDPRIAIAKDMARASMVGFIDSIRYPKPSHTQFSVRTAGPGGAPIWLTNVTYDGHTFRGRPRDGGAEMKVASSAITDWMYVDGRRLVGGYTIRAVRDSVPPERRKEFDGRYNFLIE